jgi:enoyl-CoA hydratase/carnithine racemase
VSCLTHTPGLNESAFGLNVPVFSVALMQDVIGTQAAYRAISLGTLFKSEEAQRLGFVDVLTESTDSAHVQDEALIECEKWVAIPGREGNKFNLRNDTHTHFIAERQADIEAFVRNLTEPVTQQRLGDYLASLSKKK